MSHGVDLETYRRERGLDYAALGRLLNVPAISARKMALALAPMPEEAAQRLNDSPSDGLPQFCMYAQHRRRVAVVAAGGASHIAAIEPSANGLATAAVEWGERRRRMRREAVTLARREMA